ncbi:MAG: recombinase family protein, partial [Acetobacteraceae bacterium]
MANRAAIYARYSSEMQREASIDDQIRVCTAWATRHGAAVLETYSDYAISGASTLRPGYQALKADAQAGRFDIVIAESLDRFSRDQEHIAAFYKAMCFHGVSVVTVTEGAVNELHIGLRGTMSALYLKDLAQKTHRGLEGRVRAGRSGGGLPYGYRVARDSDNADMTGARAIDEAQAMVVRRIFADYVAGISPRRIARTLNQEGIAGPRGGRWTASLLLGNAAREIGVLRNRLYAGELVWNRQRFIKDPNTGKRVARPNPMSSWIVVPVPDLRIVVAPTWEAAQHRLQSTSLRVRGRQGTTHQNTGTANTLAANRGRHLVAARRPPWLLSGLVRCGQCRLKSPQKCRLKIPHFVARSVCIECGVPRCSKSSRDARCSAR